MAIKTSLGHIGLYAAGFVLLTGCASAVSEPTAIAPSPSTASQPAASTAPANGPSKEFLLDALVTDFDTVWNADTDKGHKEICDMWATDKATVISTLSGAGRGAPPPAGVTIADIENTLTGYFDGKCASIK